MKEKTFGSDSDGETNEERMERKRRRELERLKREAEEAKKKKLELEKKGQEKKPDAKSNPDPPLPNSPKEGSSIGNVPPPPPAPGHLGAGNVVFTSFLCPFKKYFPLF